MWRVVEKWKSPKKHTVVRRPGFFNEVVKDGKVTIVGYEEFLALRRELRLNSLEKGTARPG